MLKSTIIDGASHSSGIDERLSSVVSPEALTTTVADLSKAHGQLQTTLAELREWNDRRVERSTKRTHAMIHDSVNLGDHGLAALGVLGLVADCATIRRSGTTPTTDRVCSGLQDEDATVLGRLRSGRISIGLRK